MPQAEDIPKGRPLWLRETRKDVPAGGQYDLEQAIGSKKTIYKTQAAVFQNTYDKYKRTCDL